MRRLCIWVSGWSGTLFFIALFIYTAITWTSLSASTMLVVWAYCAITWLILKKITDQRDLARERLARLENKSRPHYSLDIRNAIRRNSRNN